MEMLGKFCFALIVILFSTLIGGFVFMTLWRWFIAETFAVKQLTLIQSIGLMAIWNYIKPKRDDQDKDKKATEIFAKGLVEVIAYAAVALIFGWVIHQLM